MRCPYLPTTQVKVWLLITWSYQGRANKPLGTRLPPNSVRYTLCSDPVSAPVAKLKNGQTLSVFAASVAGGRSVAGIPNAAVEGALALRAALILEDPRGSRIRMPRKGSHRADAGHAKGVSYAKCFVGKLPNGTEVGCRVVPSNGSHGTSDAFLGEARLFNFANFELHQEFVSCVIGAPAIRWRRSPGPPARLHMQIFFAFPEDLDRYRLMIPLDMCLVREPWRFLSFCSQPLYGFGKLKQEVPWLMRDWLEYHIGHFGFEQADIYDVDGTAADALEDVGTMRNRVRYHREWPASVSKFLAERSRKYPYCSETWAYAHCITTHRALSRWVALLHAPDEYLIMGKDHTRNAVHGLLERLEMQDKEAVDSPAMVAVRAVSMARGGPGVDSDVPSSLSQRASPLILSKQRSNIRYPHTPILDPMRCIAAGAHTCYGDANNDMVGVLVEPEEGELLLYHYVEMLEKDRGRCRTQHAVCDVPEDGASWLIPLLRSGSLKAETS